MTFSKERLKDVYLHPRIQYNENQIAHIIHTLHVKEYSNLENNKIYNRCIRNHNHRWTFKIVITREVLFVFLFTNPLSEEVHFCILRGKENEKQIWLPTFQVISQCLFVSEFCNKTILDPKNGYLLDDKLIIQCKHKKSRVVLVSLDELYGKLPGVNDMHEVLQNMPNLYRTGLNSDFSIKAKDTTFWVHKKHLAARSKYFAKLFTANYKKTSISLNITPNVMHVVLIYIYAGELVVMIAINMSEVLMVANLLQIDILEKKCKDFFETFNISDHII